jgi:predicted transposase YbfD/YdcC
MSDMKNQIVVGGVMLAIGFAIGWVTKPVPDDIVTSRAVLSSDKPTAPASRPFVDSTPRGKRAIRPTGPGGSESDMPTIYRDTQNTVREIADKVTVERRYYLSSLPLDIELFARAVRGHWGVENACHWVFDVVMREDDSRTRNGHAAENLATLRRMAMNLLNRDKTKKRGIKGKQLNVSWDHTYLLHLLDF